MAGRYTPPPKMTAFPNDGEGGKYVEEIYNEMLIVRADFNALCSHHLIPSGTINGVAYIGLLPKKNLLGLSKYIRLVQWHAARGTVLHELCKQIVDSISDLTENEDVACYILGNHGCGGDGIWTETQTTVLRGEFLVNESVKSDFLRQVELAENVTIPRQKYL
jgi:GTP cyclohydrolase IA